MNDEVFLDPSRKLANELERNWQHCGNGLFAVNNWVFMEFDDVRVTHAADVWGSFLLHLNLIFVVKRWRRNGHASRALAKLTEMCDRCECGLIAFVNPCDLTGHPRDLSGHPRFPDEVIEAIRHGRLDYLEDPDGKLAQQRIELFRNAGFEAGCDFSAVSQFSRPDFPVSQMQVYIPTTMEPDFQNMIRVLNPQWKEARKTA